MKKIIWIFGESATGKKTFIENIINKRLEILEELDLLNKTFKLYVGVAKLYTLNNYSKLSDFYDAYKNNKKYELGKMFTYDPNKHYLKDDDKELLEFLINNNNYYYVFNL